jgi:DNA polymerase-3 subunit delta
MSDITADAGVLYAEFNAQSLMGGRRVVVIKEATNLLTKTLKELLHVSSSDSLLVITSLSLKTKDSLAVFAKDDDTFYGIGCYDDRDEDISQFASQFMMKNGFRIEPNAFQLLCSRLSNDRKISQNELNKLVTYMGSNKNIGINDVLTVISDTAASSQEDLCYFVALGQTEKAISSYNRLIFEGENPVSLIRTLSYHFMKLLDCAVKIEKGETADKVVFSLRPPLMFFRKNAFLSQLRVWNKNRILSALNLLYQTERECKTTDFPAEQAASFALMRIANGVRRFR